MNKQNPGPESETCPVVVVVDEIGDLLRSAPPPPVDAETRGRISALVRAARDARAEGLVV